MELPTSFRCFLFALAVGTAGVEPSVAEDPAGVPGQIDLSAFPGQIIDEVVIPIPAEVFAVLDKVGNPDWRSGIIHVDNPHRVQERGFLALCFGSLVAEGFIAVQAESADDIQKIGRKSLELAEALGLENAVKPHSLAIIEAAQDNAWDRVRAELDSTQQTVRETMARQRDRELSELVSLGGWLRGTNVLTRLIMENFGMDKAELLNQPGLVRYFRETFRDFDSGFRNTRQMTEIETGLGRVESLLRESGPINQETVKQLERITTGMLEQFYFDVDARNEEE